MTNEETREEPAENAYQKREQSIRHFHRQTLCLLTFPEGSRRPSTHPRYIFRKMLMKSLKDRRYDNEIEFLQYEWGKDYVEYLTETYRNMIWDHFGLGVEKCEEVAEPVLDLAERMKRYVEHQIKQGERRNIQLSWATLHEYEVAVRHTQLHGPDF